MHLILLTQNLGYFDEVRTIDSLESPGKFTISDHPSFFRSWDEVLDIGLIRWLRMMKRVNPIDHVIDDLHLLINNNLEKANKNTQMAYQPIIKTIR